MIGSFSTVNEFIPFWVKLASFLWWPCIGTVLCYLLITLGQHVLLNKKLLRPEMPWYEKARLTYPALLWPACCFLFLAVFFLFIFLAGFMTEQKFALVQSPLSLLLTGFMLFLVVFWKQMSFQRQFRGGKTAFVRNIKTNLTLGLIRRHLVWTVVAMFFLIPSTFGVLYVVVIASAVLIEFLFSFGLGLWIAQRLRCIRPASNLLQTVGLDGARQTGITAQHLFELDSDFVNAIALPLCQTMVFTTAILKTLTPQELVSVYAHEAAHLSESRGIMVLRILPTLFIILLLSLIPLLAKRFFVDLNVVLAIEIGLILCALFARRLVKRLEVRADRVAVQSSRQAAEYACVLEKIYRMNMTPIVLKQMSPTHPDLYDRLIAVGCPPPYERPEPPSKEGFRSLVFYLVVLIIVGLVAGSALDRFLRDKALADSDMNLSYQGMIVMGVSSWDFMTAGIVALDHHQTKEAQQLFLAAHEIAPRTRIFQDAAYLAYASQGQCEGLKEKYDDHFRVVNTKKTTDKYLSSVESLFAWSVWMDDMIQSCPNVPSDIYREFVITSLRKLVIWNLRTNNEEHN